jgi:superfamily II DNA or RNA helicase
VSPKKVNVVLQNRKAEFLRPYPYDELNETLKYRQPNWEYTPQGQLYLQWKKRVEDGDKDVDPDKPEGWDGYVHLLRYGKIGAGVFLSYKEKLEEEADCQFEVKDVRKAPEFDLSQLDSLKDKIRPYQRECFDKMVAASKTGGLILGATGTGKTFMAGLYFKCLKGNALFLVDELTLLKQAKEELEGLLGEKVGEIGNQVFDRKRITVATIQTIHRHRLDPDYVPWNKTLQVILIDEVHLALNRRNFQTIAVIQPPVIFGLTATLELKKKRIAMRSFDLCGPVVFEYPLKQGVKEEFLSKGIGILVQTERPLKTEKFRGYSWWARRQFYRAKYREEYQNLIVEGKGRNRLIQSLVKEAHRQGKYTIVLVERIQHLKDLSALMGDMPHHLVYGAKKVEQRVQSKVKFEAGRIRILLVNKVFKKGVNIKKVDVLIDGAAMKSRNDAVQKYGRGVRLADGKVGLIYLDIADVGNRFESAAKSRRTALKKLGVPLYKVSSELGAREILRLAEKKLALL